MQVCRRWVLTRIVVWPFLLSSLPATASTGQFKGSVVARWADNGRDMILTQPFEYIAPDGRRWPVPAGTTVDGASIPKFFWTTIGGPFEGLYRGASVIHDFYCQVRTRPYPAVHQVFYDAMRTAGVAETKSWLMYQAVSRFGPQWSEPKVDPKCEVVGEDYDFKYCARNFVKPSVQQPDIDRARVEEFLRALESRADPQDIVALREHLPSLR